MITIRPAHDRGIADFGWLDSRHTFSFGNYYNPKHMGFADLRVINEDKVIPGQGFGTHAHRDMEIISYVLEGALEHKDSIGTGSIIRPGDVQRMSAGTGIQHSEFNASTTEPVHFLQIWILPDQKGIKPSYEQKTFTEAEKRSTLRLVGSRDGRDGSVTIHQDVNLYTTALQEGETVSHSLAEGRAAWLQVARGTVQLNDRTLVAGDGAAIAQEAQITLQGVSNPLPSFKQRIARLEVALRTQIKTLWLLLVPLNPRSDLSMNIVSYTRIYFLKFAALKRLNTCIWA